MIKENWLWAWIVQYEIRLIKGKTTSHDCNAADIILDQFILSSWGTTTPEAMSCQKPVLMFYKEEYIKRAFGENPPILNSFSEEDIFSNLVKLAKDPDFRLSLGRKSREWIMKTHSADIVAKKHLEILTQSI